MRKVVRRRWPGVTLALLVVAMLMPAGGVSAAPGGPVVLMGIDGEDGSPFNGHGPISVYEDVVQNGVLANVSNGGSGILVLGGGKDQGTPDDVTFFWDAIGSATGETVTYVNGAAIAGQSLAGFAMIGVPSSVSQTPSGGLTQAESDLLNARGADIADFVNSGGGLFGLSQSGLTNPYGYLGVIGTFTVATNQNYDDITATAAGTAVGITDALDVFAWHDYYDVFPAFLSTLAVDAANQRVAAIGGADVVLPGAIDLNPPTDVNPVGSDHTVTATVRDSNGDPLQGVTVQFSVTAGPNAGEAGSATTDAAGQADFTYTGSGGAGDDTIQASFVDATGTTRTATAAKTWEAAVTRATINVVKSVDADPDGTFDDDPTGWTFVVAQGGAVVATMVTDASGSLTFDVDAGTGYSVSETDGPAGMWVSGVTCVDDATSAVLAQTTGTFPPAFGASGIDLVADQSITCTFTNQVMAAFLTGGGQLVDDNSGSLKKNQVEKLSFGGNVGVALDGSLHGQWQANLHNVVGDTLDKGRFHTSSIDAVSFTHDPTLEDAAPPDSLFNVVRFEATGRFDHVDGWSVIVEASDTGEPGNGKNAGTDTDSLRIRLFDPSSVLVYDSALDFPDQQDGRHGLDHGNLQIHPADG